MTPDEARTVLASARETIGVQQWQDAYDLLFPVHEEQVLTGAEQGEAAYLLGEACRGLESWDAAVYYYTEASSSGSSKVQSDAKGRLAEAGRIDAATDAEGEGVNQGEAAAVLAAGDDAYAAGQFETAMGHYRAAYDGVVDGRPKFQAALGLARSCAYLGNLDEGAQFADYVADVGPDDLADQAKSLAKWITEQREAVASSADGVSPDEYKESMDAAMAAFFSGAYAQALPLFVAAADAEDLAGVDRARMAFNAGICQRHLGNDAEARELFQRAVDGGPPQTAGKAQRNIEAIDREESAAELVAELAPD